MGHVGLGEGLALIASFLTGAAFVVVAALRSRAKEALPPQRPIIGPAPLSDREIYWPLLLGTGERLFTTSERLAMLRELGVNGTAWAVPILLCAREQEREPELLAVIEAGLAQS